MGIRTQTRVAPSDMTINDSPALAMKFCKPFVTQSMSNLFAYHDLRTQEVLNWRQASPAKALSARALAAARRLRRLVRGLTVYSRRQAVSLAPGARVKPTWRLPPFAPPIAMPTN